jgi:drug/metabolite transporter (DMT)-like permease
MITDAKPNFEGLESLLLLSAQWCYGIYLQTGSLYGENARHMQQRTNWLPITGLILAMVLWASSFIALKLAFTGYHPMVVIFGRMIIASLCFLFLIPYLKGNSYQRGDLKYILFMVICEPCLYFLFEARALENTTASQAGMITAMLPLIVAISAGVLLKEVVTKKTYAGFLLAISGACLLSLGGTTSETAPHPALGNFYEFLAMVCAAGYTISLKKLTERYNPFFLTAVQAVAGSVFYLPMMFFSSSAFPGSFALVPFLSIIYLGVFVTVGAYGLYNFGVSRIPASQASAFVNLIPVFTVFLGWAILGEKFTWVQYLASALVFVGVFISQDRSAQVEKPEILEQDQLAHSPSEDLT